MCIVCLTPTFILVFIALGLLPLEITNERGKKNFTSDPFAEMRLVDSSNADDNSNFSYLAGVLNPVNLRGFIWAENKLQSVS